MRVEREWPVLAAYVLAPLIGLGTWFATLGGEPRYSIDTPDESTLNVFLLVGLLAAVAGGSLVPSHAESIGILLGLPPLLLSPWTAPRGDNDGLWLLIVPFLVVFLVVLVFAAKLGRRLRAHE